MFLIIAGLILGFWLLYTGLKFYRTIDWDETPDPSPDLRAMHKKEAELLHIQELLAEACRQGKLSQTVVEEFNRYCALEIDGMRAVEPAWKDRHKNVHRDP